MYYNDSLASLINKFENKQPEIVFEWKDADTEAEGWIVINSLRGGAAGGGTRMRKGLNKHEVVSLAKTMEVKFSVCGPAIGGAKSGINFDPNDPRKNEVLQRWYKAVYPVLKNYYGTGGDLNVDEIHDVIPITEKLGLLHPQEGVVNGHLKLNETDKAQRIKQLQEGVVKIIEKENYTPALDKNYTIADMITGWGVAEAVKHYYNIWGTLPTPKSAIIQGWGNVAAAAAFYLAQQGVLIKGIIDISGGLIKKEGFTFDEIKEIFVNKKQNKISHPDLISFEEANKKIWEVGAEIFIPAAASRLVTKENIDTMVDNGLEVISCGANVPFADQEIFIGPIAEYTDEQVSVLPDFIANCGAARAFAYFMSADAKMDDDSIFRDTSEVIRKALSRVHPFNSKNTGIYKKALEMSLVNLV